MPNALEVLILAAIDDPKTRERFLTYLATPWPADVARSVKAEPCPAQDVAARLRGHLQGPKGRAAVVVSDRFHEEDVPDDRPSFAARDLADEFADQPYATVALAERPGKLDDIDRTVARDCSEPDFRAALELCLKKLNYLTPPDHRVLRRPVVIQAVASQTDLLKYFQLRHRIYTPMSYLGIDIERVKSGMEIDWFDTRAVHIGALEDRSDHTKFVGAARLITNEPIRQDHADWSRELAGRDPVLRQLVTDGAVQALLPVFQSHRELERYLYEAYRKGLLVGELSRVIVDPDYRGAGLSHRLVDHALDLAAAAGVHDLFLECLPIHEKLYEKSGFRGMAGARGKVYMVNRTMSVMHRLLVSSRAARGARAGRAAPEE